MPKVHSYRPCLPIIYPTEVVSFLNYQTQELGTKDQTFFNVNQQTLYRNIEEVLEYLAYEVHVRLQLILDLEIIRKEKIQIINSTGQKRYEIKNLHSFK